MEIDVFRVWREYQNGIDFKNQIKLFKTVDENIRFYEGDQWVGLQTPNIPTPVFNIIKPAGKFMAVQVKDRRIAIKFMTDAVEDPDYYSQEQADIALANADTDEAEEAAQMPPKSDLQILLDQMTDYARETWNRLNMDYKNLEGLKDAFCTGDYILYHWWNMEIETGQPFKGDIDNMLIDNVNYYPGNPNSNDVQSQPYIILVFRRMVEDVRREAKKNGVSQADIDLIKADEDNAYTSGDYGKIELEGGEKVNVFLRMWKEDGRVYFAKYTEKVQIQKKTDSKLTLYPVAMMNWETRKNCCHGVAEVTHLKSNQVYINKQMAFTQLYLLQTAYPKVLFDKAVIPEWTNKVAAAIGVNGNVNDVARYMQPPQIPPDVWNGFETTIRTTMDLLGVNDAAMGNITNPDNRSAFVAVREAAIVPLEAQQERFWQMMKDVARIWLDFWLNHYDENRKIIMDDNGVRVPVPFNLAKYKTLVFDAVIEVGESTMWSEQNTIATLGNLLQGGFIKPSQYFKAMPAGYIPNKEELMRDALKKEQTEELQQEMMMQQQTAQGGI